MAPRRRSKVGLTRMHAAVDAMRPMGFSPDVVRKSVRNLLKVYGEEGWAFIEEAAYKLLIDTLLEEPEVPRIEDTVETPLLEGGEHVSHDQPDPVHELCDKEIISEDQEHASDIQEAETKRGGISIGEQKNQELSLDVKVIPTLLKVDAAQPQIGMLFDFAPPTHTPQPMDSVPTNRRRKPCYGWISDDEDNEDDLLQLTPANCTSI